ncbi:Protein of unknown function [Gryllus bimaculatus]|nr:Protein of unknown function [Gryllus bimaculatus]
MLRRLSATSSGQAQSCRQQGACTRAPAWEACGAPRSSSTRLRGRSAAHAASRSSRPASDSSTIAGSASLPQHSRAVVLFRIGEIAIMFHSQC